MQKLVRVHRYNTYSDVRWRHGRIAYRLRLTRCKTLWMACVRAACTSANMSRYMAPITATGRKKQKTNTASMYVNDATSPRCHAKEHHVPEMRQQQMETAAIGINVNKYQIATGTIAPAPRCKNVTVSRRVCRISRHALDYLQGTAHDVALEHGQHTSHCGVADDKLQNTKHLPKCS